MDLASYLGLFVVATVFLALEPGPGFVRLAADTLRGGRRSGLLVAVGMALGAVPYVVIVALGINALIGAMPTALSALKVAGFAYLVWQAVGLLRDRPPDGASSALPDRAGTAPRHLSGGLIGGLLLVLLNPRTPILYAVYLPIFVRQEATVGTGAQLLMLGAAVTIIFLMVDIGFVLMVHRVGRRLRNLPGLRRTARYLGASLLVLFGARLLLHRE
ncbi:LysE family translocator [Microbaculum marinum]|uniref:LysE family translocator n=1 Tax=Microbaculum marinum TaxID=1764581 RepID=A0AAW9RU83_9HYPH